MGYNVDYLTIIQRYKLVNCQLMKLLVTTLSMALWLLSLHSGWSQTCCTGGVPITGALRINTFPAKSVQLRFTYDHNKIEDVFLDGEKRPDNHIKRSAKTAILQADYVLSEAFAISALVPYIWSKESVDQGSQSLVQETNGIGDISLVGQFKIPISEDSPLVLGGGIKFPTGATQKSNKDDGFVLPANLQPGTGSVDAIFLASFQAALSIRKSMLVTTSAYYRLNTASDNLTFHNSYKFGNEIQFFAGISDNFVVGTVSTSPSLLLRLRRAGKDQIEDFSNDNTGGTWLSLVPGLNLNLTPNTAIGVSADLPLYRDLNGFQITTTNKFTASLLINISKNETELRQINRPL